MEDILYVYDMEADRYYPLVCFDERPCQLLDDVLLGRCSGIELP